MTHHYVLSINPQAQYDWDKCVLRNPITGERPDFTQIIANAVGNEVGSYLISVNIEVQVLQKVAIDRSEVVSRDRANENKTFATAKNAA
jgi:hypothetical protein